jgi:hypothetical protein
MPNPHFDNQATMSNVFTTAMTIIAVALFTFGDGVAQASMQAELDVSSTEATGVAPVDNAKMGKFVDAYIDIQAIQKETAEKQSATKDPAATSTLSDEAQTKISTAVCCC